MARCSVSPPEGRITAGSFLFTQKPTSREVVNRCPTRDLPPPLVVSKLRTFSWPGASPIHCGPSSGPGVRPPVPIAPGMSSLHLVTALCSRLSRQCCSEPPSALLLCRAALQSHLPFCVAGCACPSLPPSHCLPPQASPLYAGSFNFRLTHLLSASARHKPRPCPALPSSHQWYFCCPSFRLPVCLCLC